MFDSDEHIFSGSTDAVALAATIDFLARRLRGNPAKDANESRAAD